MTPNEYQKKAKSFRIYPKGTMMSLGVMYSTLGLVDEAGEVAGKIKKLIRDRGGNFFPGDQEELKKELGDVMWYVSDLAEQLGLTLEEVMEANLEKLESRKSRDKLSGSGDNR